MCACNTKMCVCIAKLYNLPKSCFGFGWLVGFLRQGFLMQSVLF